MRYSEDIQKCYKHSLNSQNSTTLCCLFYNVMKFTLQRCTVYTITLYRFMPFLSLGCMNCVHDFFNNSTCFFRIDPLVIHFKNKIVCKTKMI